MKKRGLIALVLLIASMIWGSMTVLAADERLGTVVDGSLLTDGTEASLHTQSLARGTYLSYGTGSIYLNSYRNVGLVGATSCYRVCDRVKVALYLERLEGNSWVNVGSVPIKTAYNTSYVSTSKSFSVAGGYYYRVSGTHVAIKGDTTETTFSDSDGIWVD